MDDRLKGLMGLCVRARQCVFGEENCLKALKGGQARLLLMDGGISSASAEKYERLCLREAVPFFRIPEGVLEEATGRSGRAMAIRPGGLADRIRECLNAE